MKTHDLECLWSGLDNSLTLALIKAIKGQKMELARHVSCTHLPDGWNAGSVLLSCLDWKPVRCSSLRKAEVLYLGHVDRFWLGESSRSHCTAQNLKHKVKRDLESVAIATCQMLLLSSHSKFFHLLKSKDDDDGKLQAPALNTRFLHLKRLAQNRSHALARPTDLSWSWEVGAQDSSLPLATLINHSPKPLIFSASSLCATKNRHQILTVVRKSLLNEVLGVSRIIQYHGIHNW